MGIYISNFKGVLQTQFLSHALVHKTKIAYLLNIFKWCKYHFLLALLGMDLQKTSWAFPGSSVLWSRHTFSIQIAKDCERKLDKCYFSQSGLQILGHLSIFAKRDRWCNQAIEDWNFMQNCWKRVKSFYSSTKIIVLDKAFLSRAKVLA